MFSVTTDEFILTGAAGATWLAFTYSVAIRYETFSDPRELLMFASQSFFVTFSCWVLTGWVYIQLKRRQNNDYNQNNPICTCQRNTSKLKSRDNSTTNKNSSQSSQAAPLTLTEIVSNAEGFELFCNHLVSEYSIENMLFVLELEIIKDEMIGYQLSAPLTSQCIFVKNLLL